MNIHFHLPLISLHNAITAEIKKNSQIPVDAI